MNLRTMMKIHEQLTEKSTFGSHPLIEWVVECPAITSMMPRFLREAGQLRGMNGLLEMNEVTGFDCPSCAWLAPDLERLP